MQAQQQAAVEAARQAAEASGYDPELDELLQGVRDRAVELGAARRSSAERATELARNRQAAEKQAGEIERLRKRPSPPGGPRKRRSAASRRPRRRCIARTV